MWMLHCPSADVMGAPAFAFGLLELASIPCTITIKHTVIPVISSRVFMNQDTFYAMCSITENVQGVQ